MTDALIRVALGAGMSGGIVAFYLACILPALIWHRATVAAIVLSAAVAAGIPIGYALASFVDVPFIGILALWIVAIVIWSWPAGYVRILGGPRRYPDDQASVFAAVDEVMRRLEIGDVQGAKVVLHDLDPHRTVAMKRYLGLWQRYVDEELGRRDGALISSRQTRGEIGAELRSITLGGGVSRRVAWPAIALAAILGALPALGPATACVAVELLLRQATQAASGGQRPVADTLLADPEPGLRLVYDAPLDLDAAVDVRVDPETLRQLVEAGFLAGHQRVWETPDGRLVGVDVFEFHDPGGAHAYQADVSRYACRFSTEAFAAPGDGIGLRTYWSRGDPISEQVSWVTGSRRYVVSARYLVEPRDHARIFDLAARAIARANR